MRPCRSCSTSSRTEPRPNRGQVLHSSTGGEMQDLTPVFARELLAHLDLAVLDQDEVEFAREATVAARADLVEVDQADQVVTGRAAVDNLEHAFEAEERRVRRL